MERVPRRKARGGALVAWALATLLTGVVVWWGVTLVGGQAGSGGTEVLSSAQVARALAAERASVATRTPSPTSTSTPTPTSGEVARTVTVLGGRMGAVCRGDVVSLLYATPDDGWRVEVGSAGPEHLEVSFERREQETEVHTRCVAGVPSSRVDSEDH